MRRVYESISIRESGGEVDGSMPEVGGFQSEWIVV
jgi:hypothetical protein